MKNEANSLVLRRLTQADEPSFLEAIHAWDANADFMFAQHFVSGMKFSEYLNKLEANERGDQLPAGYVPASSFCGFVGDKIVGR